MEQLQHYSTPLSHQPRSITLLCDGISLAANIGGIFRLADAFGVEEVIFGNATIELASRKVKKVSRSTHQWVKHRISQDLISEVEHLAGKNYKIIALELTDKSLPINKLINRDDQSVALLIGSETTGVSKALLDRCKESYHIPVFGKNSSMNVTNALSIMLNQLSH